MAEESKPTPRKRPQQIRNDQPEKMEEAAREAHATLPPPGYERREVLRQRQDDLEADIQHVTGQIMRGAVDKKNLEIINDIQARTKFLTVSNADPAFVYAWVSKNNHMVHMRRLQGEGWITVQGDDPEALELKGTSGVGAGTGAPDTTRQLADVILMKIHRERYIVLMAKERARTLELQRSSASRLITMANANRKRGIILRTDDPIMGEMLEGPTIRPRKFTSSQAIASGILAGHYYQDMKEGTIPGMEINQ